MASTASAPPLAHAPAGRISNPSLSPLASVTAALVEQFRNPVLRGSGVGVGVDVVVGVGVKVLVAVGVDVAVGVGVKVLVAVGVDDGLGVGEGVHV